MGQWCIDDSIGILSVWNYESYNIAYPSKTNLKLKSYQNTFTNNFHLSCQIVLQFCTQHDNNTAGLCAKCEKDWTTEK